MITVAQIAPLRQQQTGFDETEQLKAKLAQLRYARQPFYLNAEEFEEILEWKLGQQMGRQRKMRTANTEEIIRPITGVALSISHSDQEYELELRVRTLCVLRGVGVPVASAILALTFPEKYAVIDFRGWRQIFGEERKVFFVSEYKRYMTEIRRLASELGWLAQETDYAIWEYDKRNHGKAGYYRMSRSINAGSPPSL